MKSPPQVPQNDATRSPPRNGIPMILHLSSHHQHRHLPEPPRFPFFPRFLQISLPLHTSCLTRNYFPYRHTQRDDRCIGARRAERYFIFAIRELMRRINLIDVKGTTGRARARPREKEKENPRLRSARAARSLTRESACPAAVSR